MNIDAQLRGLRVVGEAIADHAARVRSLHAADESLARSLDGLIQQKITHQPEATMSPGEKLAVRRHLRSVDASDNLRKATWIPGVFKTEGRKDVDVLQLGPRSSELIRSHDSGVAAISSSLAAVDDLLQGSKQLRPAGDVALGRIFDEALDSVDRGRRLLDTTIVMARGDIDPTSTRLATSKGWRYALAPNEPSATAYRDVNHMQRLGNLLSTPHTRAILRRGEFTRPLNEAIERTTTLARRVGDAATSTERAGFLQQLDTIAASLSGADPARTAQLRRQLLHDAGNDLAELGSGSAIATNSRNGYTVDLARVQDLMARAQARLAVLSRTAPDTPTREAIDVEIKRLAGADDEITRMYRNSRGAAEPDVTPGRLLSFAHELDDTLQIRQNPFTGAVKESERARALSQLADVAASRIRALETNIAAAEGRIGVDDVLARAFAAADTGAEDAARIGGEPSTPLTL